MNLNNSRSWLTPVPANLSNNYPKFLYRVDYKIPEEVFQYGLSIEKNNFDFFQYFFNIDNTNDDTERKCINAYENIQDALLNFRKDLNFDNCEIKDLYLYVIRCDQNFYNKEITKNSIATALHDGRISTKNNDELDKLIFSFNNFGEKFCNPLEWFTVKKVNSDQIFSASQIKIDFKKIDNDRKLKNILATPSIIDIEFRNPNYIDLNTNANDRAFVFPEELAQTSMEYKGIAYYFPSIYSNDIAKNKEPFLKSFRCENLLYVLNEIEIENKWIDKKPISKKIYFINEKNKKKEIISNFYKIDIDEIYEYINLKSQKTLNYFFKSKKIKLIFSYEKDKYKTICLNVNTTKKRSNVFSDNDTKNKDINSFVNFDNRGRFIFSFNNIDSIPFALTLTFDKSKDLATIETHPAVLNDINQTFHFEHAYSNVFYLKSNNQEYQHLELAINHQNNSFVFLNPKRKYNFSYDLVNLNLQNYSKKDQGLIYGYDSFCPELIDLNLSWTWNKLFYKPNLFVSYKPKGLIIEQARSTISKNKNHSILYSINTLRIMYVDYNNSYNKNTKIYSMLNNIEENEKYRWLSWKEDYLSRNSQKPCKWFLKKTRYDNDNLYWIISYLNSDYLWVQQRGDNWGFYFLAQKNSNPSMSTPLFYLKENTTK